MAHRYAQPITPLPTTADAAHPLDAFTWRGRDFAVRTVLAHWHLEARWWEHASPSARADAQTATASDRYYYRLACDPDLLCEVYFDLLTGQWMLDTVYD